MKRIVILFLVSSLAVACGRQKDTEVITVASEKAECVGVGPQECLLIKRDGGSGWEFWYSGIEGFDYERGYEYVLKISKEEVANQAADRSAIKYVLVKQISKTAKTSENMPPSITEKMFND